MIIDLNGDALTNQEVLFAFYKAYSKWVDNRAPEWNEYEFTRDYGLCSCLAAFVRNSYGWDTFTTPIQNYQSALFKKAGLDKCNPFNHEGYIYSYEAIGRVMHLNPRRIQWVRNYIKDYENV